MNASESCGSGLRWAAMEELRRGRVLAAELRAAVEPVLRTDRRRSELVVQLFEGVLRCAETAVSCIESGMAAAPAELAGEKRRARRNGDEAILEGGRSVGHKRRKNAEHTGSLVTTAPDYDGYQWRKYGQKWINKAKCSRSYYRCTNSKEQRCRATKTAQQAAAAAAGDGGAARLYAVDYYGRHTCKSDDAAAHRPPVVETAPRAAPAASPAQCVSPALGGELGHGHSAESLFAVPELSAFAAETGVPELPAMAVSSPVGFEPWGMGSYELWT